MRQKGRRAYAPVSVAAPTTLFAFPVTTRNQRVRNRSCRLEFGPPLLMIPTTVLLVAILARFSAPNALVVGIMADPRPLTGLARQVEAPFCPAR